MNPRPVDLYTAPHKGQRARIFQFSEKAGTLQYSDQAALLRCNDELSTIRDEFRLHATLEERYIHPILSNRVPGGAKKLNQAHRDMHEQLDNLVHHMEVLKANDTHFEKQNEMGLEFYRAWNRFIAFYLVHINEEEEEVQPTLRALCEEQELANAFNTIVGSMSPAELTGMLRMMIPAMNPDERTGLLSGVKAHTPPQAFQNIRTLAEEVLTTEDWNDLKERLGI
jgi:hypothetical protein